MKHVSKLVFILLGGVAFVSTPFLVYAQQISPNPNSGTITVGTPGGYNDDNDYNNYGSINVTDTSTLTNNGSLYNNGGTLTNNGTLNNNGFIMNVLNFTPTSTLTNNGTLNNNYGSTIMNFTTINGTGTYTQSGSGAWPFGSGLRFVNGSMTQASIQINGGAVGGSGTITGPVTIGSGGTVWPSNAYGEDYNSIWAPGTLTINGTYKTTGVLAISILNLAGGAGTGFSQLQVNGTAVLGGTLQINLFHGYDVKVGDLFDILETTGGYTGVFGQIAGASGFTPEYIGDDVYLLATSSPNPVPIPGAMLLFAPGLVGLAAFRRKLRK
jgi:hypothetical protein